MSLLVCSQNGNGWRYRRWFRKCVVYILFRGMKSPGEKDSPRRAVDSESQVSCFFLRHYISLSFVWIYSSHWDPSSPWLSHIQVARSLHGLKCTGIAFSRGSLPSNPGLYLCFSYLCQSRGLVTFFAHLTSVQFKAGACSLSVFSYLSSFPVQTRAAAASSTWLNTLRDRTDCFYILVSYFYEKVHTTPTGKQSTT